MGSFGSNFVQNQHGSIICRNRPDVPSDLLQNSSQFKRHSTRFQSPKPSWELTDENENRYACWARPDIEESYASVVKSRNQSLTIPSRLQTESADSNTKGKHNQQEFRIQVQLRINTAQREPTRFKIARKLLVTQL